MLQGENARETYAGYFARYLRGRKGFTGELVPELEGLAKVCDHVLVRRDGVSFVAVAIIDGDANPGRQFADSPEQMRLIADACCRYTGIIGGREVKPVVLAYEIGSNILDPQAMERLSRYRRVGRGSGFVSAWLLDTATKKAWTNQRLAFLGPRQAAERQMRRPRLDAKQLVPVTLTLPAKAPPPIFTILLMALLIAIFSVELALNVGTLGPLDAPSLRTLVVLGAITHSLILNAGEWWRLFTAPLLHADVSHVGYNCLALFLIGRMLEPLIRWRWTSGISAVSAVLGALFSTFINPVGLVAVGASGGILGLFAAALVVAHRVPSGKQRTRLIMMALYGLVPTLLPVFGQVAAGGEKIDYGAHLGGAIGGILMGLLLVKLWPADRDVPKFPNLSAAAAGGFAAMAALAIVWIAPTYAFVISVPLIGQAAVVPAPAPVESEGLYPRDASLLLADAISKLRAGETDAANRELRDGNTAIDRGIAIVSSPAVAHDERALWAATLHVEGEDPMARSIAAPICRFETTGTYAAMLVQDGLCKVTAASAPIVPVATVQSALPVTDTGGAARSGPEDHGTSDKLPRETTP